jgi:hypothetical protein
MNSIGQRCHLKGTGTLAVRDGTQDSHAGQRWYARLASGSEMVRKTRLWVRDGTQDRLAGQRWYARLACGSEMVPKTRLWVRDGTQDSLAGQRYRGEFTWGSGLVWTPRTPLRKRSFRQVVCHIFLSLKSVILYLELTSKSHNRMIF